MQLPSYWKPRPPAAADSETTASFDRLLERALALGPDQPAEYRLAAPKWQFLCHAAERADLVLHGSGDPLIRRFEPRQPDDSLDFSNRRAVFAATDGIWPLYYAILDRDRFPEMMLCNSCIRVSATAGQLSEPYYFFSVSRDALDQRPFRPGSVYLLPGGTFERQPPLTVEGGAVHVAQAASAEPVTPAAVFRVEPSDFPFLDQIRGHDNDVLKARIAADPAGFPWLKG
jgi:hypothetical protein